VHASLQEQSTTGPFFEGMGSGPKQKSNRRSFRVAVRAVRTTAREVGVARLRSLSAGFVFICLSNLQILLILQIWTIEESATYFLSMSL
jgi:hypothetical protein